MKTWKIRIRFFSDGKCVDRVEWGKSMRDAMKTTQSIYGPLYVAGSKDEANKKWQKLSEESTKFIITHAKYGDFKASMPYVGVMCPA